MRKAKRTFIILTTLPVILFLFSCNPVENKTRSASMLIVENLMGKDADGGDANYLQSDVVDEGEGGSGTVRADSASATLRTSPLQPEPGLGTSEYYDILVTRYTVSFSRTDGRNVPGVDVPYPFEGSLSVLVRNGSSTTFSLIVVREVAKLEPPLIQLADGRAEGVLQCTARIDFYGHDLANRNVTATGYLAVYFANYVDDQSPTQSAASFRQDAIDY